MHFERGREPMTALRYYAEAAGTALASLIPAECKDLAECGLSLLGRAPEGTERNTLEIALATLCGMADFNLLGVGPEAKGAFQRAYGLLADIPQHPLRGLLLYGFGFVLSLRTEYGEALAVAERAEALGIRRERSGASARRLHRPGARAPASGPAARRPEQDRARASGDGVARRRRGDRFRRRPAGHPAGTAGHPPASPRPGRSGPRAPGPGARTRARRGPADGAPDRHLVRRAVRAAARQRRARCCARRRNAGARRRVRACPRSNGEPLVSRLGDARMGEPREGCRRIVEACEDNVRLGMLAGASETLAYAVEAAMLAGDWDAAQHQLEEALQIASVHGERVYLPQLFLLEAAVCRTRGESDAADAAVRRAVDGGTSAGGPLARADGAGRTLRTRRCNGRRSTGACRTRRSTSRSDRYNHPHKSASAARQGQARLKTLASARRRRPCPCPGPRTAIRGCAPRQPAWPCPPHSDQTLTFR